MELVESHDDMDVCSTSAVETLLTTLTSQVATTVGAVVTAATVAPTVVAAVATAEVVAAAALATEVQMQVEKLPQPPPPAVAAWDFHLDSPPGVDAEVNRMMQLTRWAALGLTSEALNSFATSHEFISLGCCCAVSNAMQLIGLKRNSYPFDWVRSSLEGIMHCLDVQFEDFLTYSTYTVSDQYVVFGGTRWGGSFWHHNLEIPMTRSDMARRVSRFYGRENVPTCTPKVFVRGVNSTREINAALRFKRCLHDALPGQDISMLFIVELQTAEGPMAVTGQDGLLIYGIPETETMFNMGQGTDAFRLCSETYTRALAFAIKHWAGESTPGQVRMFDNLNQLSAACVQFDGGDAGRELFTPRKFYGQQMDALTEATKFQSLLAKIQSQMFLIPQNTDISATFPVQCFGRNLKVTLPAGTIGGNVLLIYLNDGALTANVSATVEGQLTIVGAAAVEELLG